jgi:antitoxin component of RelBE/YafQ-DinJ toxin-antitoxin module
MEFVHVQARINREENKKVKKIAFETGTSVSTILRIGIQKVIDEYEENGKLSLKGARDNDSITD